MIFSFLLAGLPLDSVGDPLPQYLNVDAVQSALEASKPRLHECGTDDELTVKVDLSIHGDGIVSVERLVGVEGDQAACWRTTLNEGTRLRHDDTPQRVTAIFYVRSEQVLLSPELTLHQRTPSPLLIFSPGLERERIYSVIHTADTGDQ